MRITGNMKIKEVLAIDEEKMIETLMWLAPAFERLRFPKLRRAMAGRVSVAQAARIAQIPLAEMLYVTNLAIGADEAELSEELGLCNLEEFQYTDTNLPTRPSEIAAINDDHHNVTYLDLMPQADKKCDPMPMIAKGLAGLKTPDQILLLRHPFDPIPLRDMFARKGFASWAEERKEGEWFIYFYKPALAAKASAQPQVKSDVYARAFAVAA